MSVCVTIRRARICISSHYVRGDPPVKACCYNSINCRLFHRVTTKNPKTTFRLASELTGMEGMVECTTWEKVRVAFLARGLVWGRVRSCLSCVCVVGNATWLELGCPMIPLTRYDRMFELCVYYVAHAPRTFVLALFFITVSDN
jgi:hypothetical protein